MDPFKVAERYIQLRRLYASRSMATRMLHLNELILTPLSTLVGVFLRSIDMLSCAMACLSIYRAWTQWMEYSQLQFSVQTMLLEMMATGGPQISTNDPEYLPYVYADAVVRQRMRRPDSGGESRRSPDNLPHPRSHGSPSP